MGWLYFLIIIIANCIGAVSGMGGGVVIKPILDFIGHDPVATITFYSTVAVFTMSLVSTGQQLVQGIKIKKRMLIFIVLGSATGGYFGNVLFQYFLDLFTNQDMVKLIQIVLMIMTLLFALFYTHFEWRSFHLRNPFTYVVVGLMLGVLASFLGVGGGPINVSLLLLLFSVTIKEATVYSIGTIFFSQFSKLLTITFTTGFDGYDLSMLFYIIPAAVIGGFLGARLSRVLSERHVLIVFQLVIVVVLLINIYNGWVILT